MDSRPRCARPLSRGAAGCRRPVTVQPSITASSQALPNSVSRTMATVTGSPPRAKGPVTRPPPVRRPVPCPRRASRPGRYDDYRRCPACRISHGRVPVSDVDWPHRAEYQRLLHRFLTHRRCRAGMAARAPRPLDKVEAGRYLGQALPQARPGISAFVGSPRHGTAQIRRFR